MLHLEFNQLKRAAEAGTRNRNKPVAPTFVELIPPQTSAAQECVLELESARGKLRIELKGTTTAELAGIGRALWEILA